MHDDNNCPYHEKAAELDRLMTDEYVNALQENKQLKEELSKTVGDYINLKNENDILKQKLEKIKKWCQDYGYPTKDGFREQEFNELKEILGENK